MKKAYEGREPTITELIRDNIINGTQLIEQAVSRVEGIGLCPVGDHRDLIDDSDVKTTTVQKVTSKVWKVLKDGKKKRYITTSYSCIIQDVCKKWGVLRIITWNPFADKYQYFLIPPSAVFGNKHLKISFDGTTFAPTGKYAQFEVSKFEDASRKLTVRDQIDTIVCNINKDNIVEQIGRIMNFIPDNTVSYSTPTDNRGMTSSITAGLSYTSDNALRAYGTN